ncbi:mCG54937, isoform CRA_c [Mus musculus]|nr:mCG54937, isoform CRA_c [Mus musculus]EDL26716.1 mCG54937, isoform CRA_c [Mus musculus]
MRASPLSCPHEGLCCYALTSWTAFYCFVASYLNMRGCKV